MVEDLIQKQNDFFASQQTKDINFRKQSLQRLMQEIKDREDAICDALYADFKKPKFEALATETQLVLAELNYAIKNISKWSSPIPVETSWTNFPSKDWIQPEPYGKVLVISPWNYPFMLALTPVVGALAAGNTVLLKPSELSPNTSKIIAEIITKVFPREHVGVVEGGVEVSQELLSKKWEYIFFTWSTRVGQIVYKSAAEHLTPVTLELGGKNPCIVDESAQIKLAAKRIAWGKFINAGQTCLAPDYILVHESVKDLLVEQLKQQIQQFYGENVETSPDFARMATAKHYQELKESLKGQKLLFGGECNDTDQYISPTLVDAPDRQSALMTGEIFGPILPIIPYTTEADLDRYILSHAEPLALYVFSRKGDFQKKIMSRYRFGGGAINDTVIHISNKQLPFGGVGQSGMGAYHGKHSFELFSHHKSVVKRSNWLDVPLRYAPYKIPIRWVKKIRHLF